MKSPIQIIIAIAIIAIVTSCSKQPKETANEATQSSTENMSKAVQLWTEHLRTEYGYLDDIETIIPNQASHYDIDKDGKEELILRRMTKDEYYEGADFVAIYTMGAKVQLIAMSNVLYQTEEIGIRNGYIEKFKGSEDGTISCTEYKKIQDSEITYTYIQYRTKKDIATGNGEYMEQEIIKYTKKDEKTGKEDKITEEEYSEALSSEEIDIETLKWEPYTL